MEDNTELAPPDSLTPHNGAKVNAGQPGWTSQLRQLCGPCGQSQALKSRNVWPVDRVRKELPDNTHARSRSRCIVLLCGRPPTQAAMRILPVRPYVQRVCLSPMRSSKTSKNPAVAMECRSY